MFVAVGQFVDRERVHRGMVGKIGRRLVREVKASRRRQLAQKNHNRVRRPSTNLAYSNNNIIL